MQTYKEDVLLPGEEVVASLQVVGFNGILGHSTDLKIGHGLMLCTKLGTLHRIHFYINDHVSDPSQQTEYETEIRTHAMILVSLFMMNSRRLRLQRRRCTANQKEISGTSNRHHRKYETVNTI